ncbi:MAG: hypothetical protein ACTSVV_05765, partial [Promethearchaeota archaeon]
MSEKKMSAPFKEVVFDAGVIIDLLLSGEDSRLFKNILSNNIIPNATTLAIIEAEYILCRKLGKNIAFKKINNLLESNYIDIFPLENIRREISILKCNVPIALPDCATIALATKFKIPALFAKKEREMEKPLENNVFKIKIYFLEN